jgi:hypothetical protein
MKKSPVAMAMHLFLALPGIQPFQTNFCTGFPNGTRKEPAKWAHCCAVHDLFFWAGGCKPHRKEADLALRTCVRETGEPIIAEMMYIGVRLGSLSPVKLKGERWSHGWLDGRNEFKSLGQADLVSIRESLRIHPPKAPDSARIDFFLETLQRQIESKETCG